MTRILKNFVLTLFLFLTTMAFAEGTSVPCITGKVIDNDTGQPLEYATVRLFTQDSVFVSGVITDMKGSFSIQAPQGNYIVTIQFMGYETLNVNVKVSGNESEVQLGRLLLRPDVELLEEVEVIAERSTMSMTLDKRVFNVGKDVSSTAGNAIEVLENIPSVTVDVEGNVSLRGDDGVQILVDGKESGLVGVSTQDALRSLQADMIERIEVVTNPSVRYDAEGTAGIINIVLKKDKRTGFNGSVDLRGGFPFEWGEKMPEPFPFQAGVGTSLNYRLRRFNFFLNYNYNYRDNISDGYTETEYFNGESIYDPDIQNHADATEITKQTTERIRHREGHTVRGGLDYYISDNDILSFSAMYRKSNGSDNPIVTYRDFFPLENSDIYTVRAEDNYNTRPMQEYTLSYDKYFITKENSLKASIRYFTTEENEWSDIEDSQYNSLFDYENNNPFEHVFQTTDSKELQRNLQGTVDFVYHLGPNIIEAGAKYTNRFINNIMEVTENDMILDEYTHDFDYNQQVAALYAIYGREWGLFSLQAGARLEYTYLGTEFHNTGESHEQKYLNLFPSAHINYNITENDQMQVSYTRRIRRPGYFMIAPFRSFNDDRNIRLGNPAIRPVFTDSYELSYIKYWEKGNFNLTGYYRHSVDVFRNFTFVEGDVSYSRPENFGFSDDYGLEVVGSLQLFKWWNLNGNLNFFKSVTVGDYNDRHYLTDSYNLGGRIVSKFSINKICDMQITGHYRSPHDEPLGYREANYWADFAASRDVLKGKGTVTLNIRDVFGSRQHGGYSWGDDFWQYSENSWSKTTVTLNFNYRINQQSNNRKKNMNTPSDDSYDNMEYSM